MKTILKLTTVLVFTVTASFANSSETSLKFNKESLIDSVSITKGDEVLKPYFRVAKEKLFVNFLNLDKSKVVIKIYDEEYRVVFSETVTEEMIIEKAFNFESAYAGNYRVVVSDTSKSYSENFVVD